MIPSIDPVSLLLIAGAVVLFIPWGKLVGYVKQAVSKNDTQPDAASVTAWEANKDATSDCISYVLGVEVATPAVGPAQRWAYVLEGLSPIKAAIRAQEDAAKE